MPRGEKSGNARMKPHRARRIADRMIEAGATRKDANRIAHDAMDREYARSKPRGARKRATATAHDSRSGESKTRLTTRRGAAISGAAKPSAARSPAHTKRASGPGA